MEKEFSAWLKHTKLQSKGIQVGSKVRLKKDISILEPGATGKVTHIKFTGSESESAALLDILTLDITGQDRPYHLYRHRFELIE